MPEHVDIVDPEIHEPKGVGAATAGQVYVADGLGSGAWTTGVEAVIESAAAGSIAVATGGGAATEQIPVRMGWEDYNDAATAGTPITLSTAAAYFNMTNDGAGVNTNTAYKIPGATTIWNTTTNRFDFTGYNVGDTVVIRWDMTFTTTGVNHEIHVRIRLAEGTGGQYELGMFRKNYKAAGTYNETGTFFMYLGDTNTQGNPGLIQVASDTGTTDTVVVNGWVTQVTTRSDF